jgi:MYXO-CTERM domain-containing protein
MKINPVTYCVTSLREGLGGRLDTSMAGAALFALLALLLSLWTVRRRS